MRAHPSFDKTTHPSYTKRWMGTARHVHPSFGMATHPSIGNAVYLMMSEHDA